MPRISALTLALALSLTGATTLAQTASDSKPAAKTATPRSAPKSETKSLALASETAEAISANQLDIAARVLTGKAECEYNQTVDVEAVREQPGAFTVRFKAATYVMVPEETSTGAIKLLDRKTGVVWLQIPSKSMLLNSRAGQRLVDRCTQSEQRTAMAAVAGAANSSAKAAPAADASTPRK